MTIDPQAIVLDFIAQFRESWPADFDKTLSVLADDAIYQIVVPTVAPIRGRAAIKAELEKMKASVADQKHEMKGVGFDGKRKVFTERIDQSLRNGKWTPIPLVAVWEVNDAGQISTWREYLDLSHAAKLHNIPIDKLLASLEPA